MIKLDLLQEYKVGLIFLKTIIIFQHVNKIKKKNHSNKCRKNIDKMKFLFILKTISKLDRMGLENFLKMIWGTLEKLNKKPTTNIIVNSERLKAFPLKLEIKQRCLYNQDNGQDSSPDSQPPETVS